MHVEVHRRSRDDPEKQRAGERACSSGSLNDQQRLQNISLAQAHLKGEGVDRCSNPAFLSDRDSIVVLTILPDGKNGKIELTHLDVPESDFNDVNKDWLDYYWKPWRASLEKELLKPEKRAA
jgi:hypothetical protein